MKKFFVSMGLAAAGTTGLHAAYAPDVTTMDTAKVWSLSGTLRGFFDDNYTTQTTGRGSYGFEFSPSFGLNIPMQQTEIGLRYTFGLYYYQDRQEQDQDPVDMTHQLDFWLAHAFTERWQAKLQDSLVVAQEPELLAGGVATATPRRISGSNVSNSGVISVNTDWTRMFSTVFTYQNKFYDYQNSGGTALNPSYAGTLNRIEQYFSLDFQWHLAPLTTLLVGYEYEQVNYTGDEVIGAFQPVSGPITIYHSNSRDNFSHIAYLGAQHAILPNLSISAEAGVQYTDDYNDNSTSLGPYANATLTYTYTPGAYAEIGVTDSRNATDEVSVNANNGSITLDQESTVVYGSINHNITPKLLATLIGQIQFSDFNGGAINNQSETFYSVGLNLNYNFTQHVSAEIGYNFDHDDSTVAGRSYFRHRVYVGITGTY
jgi:Putative beta-barrel porin 2